MNQDNESLERFCAGDALAYAIKGIKEIPGTAKRSHENLAGAIQSEYGTSLSDDVGGILDRVTNARKPMEVVEAVRDVGLNDVDDLADRIPEDELDQNVDNVEDPGLAEAMRIIDTKMGDALCPRDKGATACTSKKERTAVYVPELVKGDGTVFMAKSMSSTKKLRIAWDLDDDNEVVVVDDYEKWENLLGWRKLKELPHGKNKIREELGDQLSDEVLEVVAGEKEVDNDSSDDDGPSRGRRTRTKPSEEVLNIARGSRHRQRTKIKSKQIAETFDDGDSLTNYRNVSMLVLFPSTCDLNMTNHWWVAGDYYDGNVAIANCNKGTFEYLNQYEQVWHIEDYLDQALDYEFETNDGPLTMRHANESNLVFHVLDEEPRRMMMRDSVIGNVPEALTEYCREEVYGDVGLPEPDDMVYAPLDMEDVFWLRPLLREQVVSEADDATVLYAGTAPRDVGNAKGVSSDYKLYARARLPDWDFDSVEMKKLDKASHYLDLNNGGFEVAETLAKLHDQGEAVFSESPESRWNDVQ